GIVIISILRKNKIVHINFTRIVTLYSAHLYLLASCRTILIGYQLNIFEPGESSSWTRLVLYVSSICHLHEVCMGAAV
ncbi:hypothetical protein PFISCL1PPCAC_14104, partial [Pristionchus fissidentatus]